MKNMPKITRIDIYPVKSLPAIRVAEAAVERRGLARDRRWMIVDEEGMFITQRALPHMATVRVTAGLDHIQLASERVNRTLTIPTEAKAEGESLSA